MSTKGLILNNRNKSKKNSFLALLNKDLFASKLNNRRREFFYLELFSMLQAGMDIKDSFDILIDQQEKEALRDLFRGIKTDIIGGYSLSESLQRTEQFTAYEYFCVQIGEESGQLMDVLEQLAKYFGDKSRLGRQIMKSISYPAVILITSLLAVAFMITFIVPMFSSVFQRFGKELPDLTKVFISLSDALKSNFFLIASLITGITIIMRFFWDNPTFRQKRQIVLNRLPYFGEMVRSIYLTRFCSALALLMGAKVPLVQSVQLVIKMIDFFPIKLALEQVEKDLLNGKTLNESLSVFKIFDSKMISLIKVGEEVNRLEFFFGKLQTYYSDDVDMKSNALNTFLEPIIIIFLGLTIGTMLVAMYLPMFQLSGSIG